MGKTREIKAVTFVADTDAFMAELEQMAPTYVYTAEDGTKKWTVFHTPIKKNANGSLATSLLTPEEFEFVGGMTTIVILGTSMDDIKADPQALATYKSVYPYDVPVGQDENGNDIFMPEFIGGIK